MGYTAGMQTTEISVDTSREQLVDLTDAVSQFCHDRGSGLLNVFVPHATAGLGIFELGSGSERDLPELLSRLVPRDDRYAHLHGEAGHGADHLLPALLSPSVSVPVTDGVPLLGRWQSLVLVDTNRSNPLRRVLLSFLAG